MSRSGYTDDVDDVLQLGRWRAQVKSATRGKRGQKMLRDLVAALDAMESKELHARVIVSDDGCCCAMGALLKHRGVEEGYVLKSLEIEGLEDWELEERNEDMASDLDVAHQLVAEVVYHNDDTPMWHFAREWRCTEEEARWRWMREWASKQLLDQEMDVESVLTEES